MKLRKKYSLQTPGSGMRMIRLVSLSITLCICNFDRVLLVKEATPVDDELPPESCAPPAWLWAPHSPPSPASPMTKSHRKSMALASRVGPRGAVPLRQVLEPVAPFGYIHCTVSFCLRLQVSGQSALSPNLD